MVSALSGIEMYKISAGELRDVGKLYHLEDEAEITQKELADLENRKIATKQEMELHEYNNWEEREERIEFANKEIEKEIERNDLE